MTGTDLMEEGICLKRLWLTQFYLRQASESFWNSLEAFGEALSRVPQNTDTKSLLLLSKNAGVHKYLNFNHLITARCINWQVWLHFTHFAAKSSNSDADGLHCDLISVFSGCNTPTIIPTRDGRGKSGKCNPDTDLHKYSTRHTADVFRPSADIRCCDPIKSDVKYHV